MLKIPACGLPNPAVSFKKSYRKHGEFAPLLNTTDKRDRGLQSIDKIQNKLRYDHLSGGQVAAIYPFQSLLGFCAQEASVESSCPMIALHAVLNIILGQSPVVS